MRVFFLQHPGFFGPHSTCTTERGLKSQSSRIRFGFGSSSYMHLAFLVLDVASLGNLWLSIERLSPWALAWWAVVSAAFVAHFAFTAWRMKARAERAAWAKATLRRDQLKRARAEAVRRHQSVSAIDAELIPLTASLLRGRP